MVSPYHSEQIEAITMVVDHIDSRSAWERQKIEAMVSDYLVFRREVEKFLTLHFGDICTQTCYRSQLSACCSREGIITFFADVVVNQLASEPSDIEQLLAALTKPNDGYHLW